MSELITLGLKEAAAKIKAKEISAKELTEAYIERIDARNETINAFITQTSEQALEMAKASDDRIKNSNPRLLEGVPLGIKDLFCTKGTLTTAGSKILHNFIPAYESTVTQNLWITGAVMLGKLNLDEFAMGSSNESSYYGPVKNPWDQSRVPGGSSGGSAAAVADFMCAGATATDTGGSIRQPAAFSGVVGLKPTYGRCSRYGIVAFASSLDQAGPMARSVEDCALMFRAMAGYDAKDSTSADIPIEAFDEKLTELDIKGLRIGVPSEYFVEGLHPENEAKIRGVLKQFEDAGAELVEISLAHTKYGIPAYYVIAPAEAASNLARYDGMRYGLRVEGADLKETYVNTRSEGFGDEVQRRIMIGNYTLSSGYYDAYYLKAQRVRAKIKQEFDQAFEKVDVIISPATPDPAFKFGENADDPVKMYLNDVLTVTTNLAGLPGLSIPAGTVETDGKQLPVGLQIIGPAFSEQKLLQVGYAAEQMIGFEKLGVQN